MSKKRKQRKYQSTKSTTIKKPVDNNKSHNKQIKQIETKSSKSFKWQLLHIISKLKQPFKLAFDVVFLILVMIIPYYIAAICENSIMHSNIKNMDPHAIVHLDKTIDFIYTLAATVIVGLVWLILRQMKHDLSLYIGHTKSKKRHYVTKIVKPIKIIGAIIELGLVSILPYYTVTTYEVYITHLHITGLDKYTLSHLTKSLNFFYILAAISTIVLIYLVIKQIINIIKDKNIHIKESS